MPEASHRLYNCRALRAAGTDLPALRPRQPVLRRRLCAAAPARVAAPCRPALPDEASAGRAITRHDSAPGAPVRPIK
ncbi:MAG: hypothetical protein MZW92_74190 [Comamonadaceae bacterium]|nr:hypothetical protein [Comamonadaceae bacterium]